MNVQAEETLDRVRDGNEDEGSMFEENKEELNENPCQLRRKQK